MVYRRNIVIFLLPAFLFLYFPLFARGGSESRISPHSTAEHSGLDVPGMDSREENPLPENPAGANASETSPPDRG
ncbi:MAG: hypothetical protein LBK40_04835 [Spirochaetaceae bacterium]|nr:hypothetical protein [Spirochaetaceae bacterium]